jgi:two-component system, OmpR family, KDP operon response regulator KdpE
MHVALIEDDEKIGSFVSQGLRQAGHVVSWVRDGNDGLELARQPGVDLAIVDVMLPGRDGLSIIRALREKRNALAVIVLSARAAVDDRVLGLEAGADDYLTKPFGVNELLARIRVALRHARGAGGPLAPVLEFGALKLDLDRREVFVDGKEVHLTPIEYKLLALLAKHAGKVLTHRQILKDVWGPNQSEHTHYVRVHMAELRKKIEANPARPVFLATEPGVGYRLRDRPSEQD